MLGPIGKVSVAVVASSACVSSGISAPPYAPQPTSALAEVPYPPPPARVEQVPASPSRNATWIDGEWTWKGSVGCVGRPACGGSGRWLWTRGRWVLPPPGARYSAWAIVRAKDGRLWEAPGTWRDAHGDPIAPPAPLAEADVSGAAVVDSFGDLHAAGRTLRAPGEQKGAKR